MARFFVTNQQDKSPKLDKLGKAIREASLKYREPEADKQGSTPYAGLGMAYRICIEMLAGVLVGCVLGYYLDLWLDTKPILFMVCFFLGILGSGLNIYRMATNGNNDPKNLKTLSEKESDHLNDNK